MKQITPFFLFFCLCFSQKATAQTDPWTDAAMTYGPDVFAKAKEYAGWLGCRFSHRWWACEYADGTIVYNNPRCYRSGSDVYNYFTGKGGDCDAFFYDARGREIHLCYRNSDDAIQQVTRFGKIVAIYPTE